MLVDPRGRAEMECEAGYPSILMFLNVSEEDGELSLGCPWDQKRCFTDDNECVDYVVNSERQAGGKLWGEISFIIWH